GLESARDVVLETSAEKMAIAQRARRRFDRDDLTGRGIADEEIVDRDPGRASGSDPRCALPARLARLAIVRDDDQPLAISNRERDDVARDERRPLDRARGASASRQRTNGSGPAYVARESVDGVELRRRACPPRQGE